MRNISVRFVTIGLVYALLAMALGIWMGVNQDFQNAHLHAHINLVAAVWFVASVFVMIVRHFLQWVRTAEAADRAEGLPIAGAKALDRGVIEQDLADRA